MGVETTLLFRATPRREPGRRPDHSEANQQQAAGCSRDHPPGPPTLRGPTQRPRAILHQGDPGRLARPSGEALGITRAIRYSVFPGGPSRPPTIVFRSAAEPVRGWELSAGRPLGPVRQPAVGGRGQPLGRERSGCDVAELVVASQPKAMMRPIDQAMDWMISPVVLVPLASGPSRTGRRGRRGVAAVAGDAAVAAAGVEGDGLGLAGTGFEQQGRAPRRPGGGLEAGEHPRGVALPPVAGRGPHPLDLAGVVPDPAQAAAGEHLVPSISTTNVPDGGSNSSVSTIAISSVSP
jgi:hypothetical protein